MAQPTIIKTVNSIKSSITDPLPYNCENEQTLSQPQVDEGEAKNCK